uniref:Uncharacterized protein n=1 Tax=Rhodosorus marinus TaxID=101924 RepID=A0A7S3ER07_9RHOD|mmetsp:Transcript_9871/g.41888  ORF Transcript_9871/g.41888 Transcript_9871/m.41888 type:complete len:114 (+) Transcript_9871:846-1187(+)
MPPNSGYRLARRCHLTHHVQSEEDGAMLLTARQSLRTNSKCFQTLDIVCLDDAISSTMCREKIPTSEEEGAILLTAGQSPRTKSKCLQTVDIVWLDDAISPTMCRVKRTEPCC